MQGVLKPWKTQKKKLADPVIYLVGQGSSDQNRSRDWQARGTDPPDPHPAGSFSCRRGGYDKYTGRGLTKPLNRSKLKYCRAAFCCVCVVLHGRS